MINGSAFAPAGLRATALDGLHPAARLAAVVLGLLTCMVATPSGLVVLVILLGAALWWTGLEPARQLGALKPWTSIALLVVAVHTFTTIWAAPLGHPSVAGALAGGKALLRVACSVGCLGLYLRVTPLDDLVVGVRWWLRPAARLGLNTDDLGLMLAVAMGTAPVVLGEGRRIQAAVAMRKAAPAGWSGPRSRGPVGRFFSRIKDRTQVMVPLLESLVRRSEALSLTLRRRRPVSGTQGSLPWWQLALLTLWAAGLVGWVVLVGPEVGR